MAHLYERIGGLSLFSTNFYERRGEVINEKEN